MESNNTLWIIVIVVTLIPFASSAPLRDSYVARALLSINPPSESPSPSPSPSLAPINSPANPPAEEEIELVDSPAPSPGVDAISISPAEEEIELVDSPASSPEIPAISTSPADSPTEEEIELVDSPTWSPESSPADADSPTESDSPAPSPNSIPTTNSVSITSEESESLTAPAGRPSLMSSAKNLLKSTLLSPAIKSICGQTSNATLCESSIAPLLTPGLKADTPSVLVLVTKAAINATKAAVAIIDKEAAPDCVELYDDALSNLEDAINAVIAGDGPTVNTNLNAAMTDYGTCNDGFEESGEPNPLVDVSEKLTKMVSNCLALSTLLK